MEASAFEAVAQAIEAFTPRLEILCPGTVATGTRGPSRYFGGDEALAGKVVDAVDGVLGERGTCSVGIADGTFAALQAARQAAADPAQPNVGGFRSTCRTTSPEVREGGAAGGHAAVPGPVAHHLSRAARAGRRVGPAGVAHAGGGGGAVAGRRGGAVRRRGGGGAPAGVGARRAAARPSGPAARPGGGYRAGPAGRAGRPGGVRGQGAGRPAHRAARSTGDGLHPPGGRGRDRLRRAAGPTVAPRRRRCRPGPSPTGSAGSSTDGCPVRWAVRASRAGAGAEAWARRPHRAGEAVGVAARRGGSRHRSPAGVLGWRRRGRRAGHPHAGPGAGSAWEPMRSRCPSGGAAVTRPSSCGWCPPTRWTSPCHGRRRWPTTRGCRGPVAFPARRRPWCTVHRSPPRCSTTGAPGRGQRSRHGVGPTGPAPCRRRTVRAPSPRGPDRGRPRSGGGIPSVTAVEPGSSWSTTPAPPTWPSARAAAGTSRRSTGDRGS